VEEITLKMAEATTHDVLVRGDSSKTPYPSVKAYYTKVFAELSNDEKWQLSYDIVDMPMKDICGRTDQ
jgi:hypothetical protein